MPRNRAVTWLLVSMVSLKVGLAAAEPPEPQPNASPQPTAAKHRPVEEPAAPEGEDEALVGRGVVVESVGKGSALEKAGLQPGDVLYHWRRLPSPPANPDEASGELESPFDWMELKVEQAPRGQVELSGRREGLLKEWTVLRGEWVATLLPHWDQAEIDRYHLGWTRIQAGDVDGGVGLWALLLQSGTSAFRLEKGHCSWVQYTVAAAWAQARQWDNHAVALQECERLGLARSETINILNNLGMLALNAGNLAIAEQYLDRSLVLEQKRSPLGMSYARTSLHLGLLAKKRGNLALAIEFYQRSLEIAELLAPDSLAVAGALTNLGNVMSDQGDWSVATKYLERALEIVHRQAPRSEIMSSVLVSLGVLALLERDLKQAENYQQQALEIAEELSLGNAALATPMNNLGVIAWLRGDLEKATTFYERSLQIRQILSPESLAVATILNNLGILAKHRHDLDQAAEFYRRALEIKEERAPSSLAVAITFHNLGILAVSQGDLSAAAEYYSKALTIEEEKVPSSLDVARTLNQLAVVARERGDRKQALLLAEKALTISQGKSPEGLDVAVILNNIGIILREQGRYSEATKAHEHALTIRRTLAIEMAFEDFRELARVARDQHELDEAVEFFGQALTVLESNTKRLGSSRETEGLFRSGNEYPVYLEALSLQVERRQPEAAFELLERSRAQSYLAMLAERELVFSDLPSGLDGERRRLALQYDRALQSLHGLSPAKDEEQIKNIQGDLLMLRQRQQEIQVGIRVRFPRLAAIQYPQPLDVGAVRRALDQGTVLLAYSVGEKESFVFSVSAESGLSVRKLSVGEVELRQRVVEFRHLLDSAAAVSSLGTLRASRLREVARELYALLVQPAEESLAAGQRLLLLADGPLHLLPFAALQRPDGQYLGAWRPLHAALSATVWAELKATRRPVGSSSASPAFTLAAFGDPQYPRFKSTKVQPATDGTEIARSVPGDFRVRAAVETGLFDWSPLPGTRREVREIARFFPEGSAHIFLGQDATEDTAKALGREPRIVHFAAHGHLDDRFPWNSALVLSIPENPPEGRNNGLLQVWEILESIRFDADLVVLSACETGLGEEQGGEGLIGLTRAFQFAGARSVLASLWNVQDQATSELMIRFYKHLRAGLSKDQALQAAQRELTADPIEVTNEKGEREIRDFSAPYYWAGFQLYGDWQ